MPKELEKGATKGQRFISLSGIERVSFAPHHIMNCATLKPSPVTRNNVSLMATPGEINNEIMVPYEQCSNQVWIRKDRLQAHILKVHSSGAIPKKSFTTYKARIASTFPPRVLTPSTTVKHDDLRLGTTSR